MMKFEISLAGLVRGREADELLPDDHFFEVLDAVTEALLELKAEEPSIEGSAKNGTFEVSLVLAAENEAAALSAGNEMIRSAIHAAGLRAANWPRWYAAIDSRAELISA